MVNPYRTSHLNNRILLKLRFNEHPSPVESLFRTLQAVDILCKAFLLAINPAVLFTHQHKVCSLVTFDVDLLHKVGQD